MKCLTSLTDQQLVHLYVDGNTEALSTLVTRYKDGLAQRDMAGKLTLPERFTKVNGAAAWSTYISNFQRAINKTWSEILMYREDVSSK